MACACVCAVCAAVRAYSHLVIGRKLQDIFDGFGRFWRELTQEPQMRWVESFCHVFINMCGDFSQHYCSPGSFFSHNVVASKCTYWLQSGVCLPCFSWQFVSYTSVYHHKHNEVGGLTIYTVISVLLTVTCCSWWCVLQLGPEKGVTHLAVAAIINALWDLWAKMEDKVLWQPIIGTNTNTTTPPL